MTYGILEEESYMEKKIALYSFTIIVAIILFVVSMTVLGETELAAPIIIVISVYLFVGSLIKLCKLNDRFKNLVITALDILFWLP